MDFFNLEWRFFMTISTTGPLQVDGGKGRACRGANRGDNQATGGATYFLGMARERFWRHFFLETLENVYEHVACWILLLFFPGRCTSRKIYIYTYSFQLMRIEFEFGGKVGLVEDIDIACLRHFVPFLKYIYIYINPNVCLTDNAICRRWSSGCGQWQTRRETRNWGMDSWFTTWAHQLLLQKRFGHFT